HLFFRNGQLIEEKWDLPRNSAIQSIQTHGLYSGAGSITYQGHGRDYDFNWQPIDLPDAIAKAHDIEYYEATRQGGPSQGYVEDVRTLNADLRMLARVEGALNGGTASELGVEQPFRTGELSGEGLAALNGQKAFIGMLASWKGWKITQE